MLNDHALNNQTSTIKRRRPVNCRPSIIDIEASGFGADSYPIEIGLILSNGDKYCSLISPCADWQHWDESAESVHGISKNMLKEYGRHVKDVAETLNTLLAGQVIYSDGWVVDQIWLNRLFYAANLRPTFTFSALENILNEQQMDIWHPIKQNVTSELALQRHRASNDAVIIQETFARSQQKSIQITDQANLKTQTMLN
ncbi:3'-5' exonuclease [Algibacillus agarilyticus]|uniref:3'-5' exonuclease n=1 Tax=Algibacillus agarilyticus TaxID=2234133 RepID=UPI000DD04363|nr:hypothetical protein [Algibacillus agarilyticus]